MRRTFAQRLFLYLVPGMLVVLAATGWMLDRLVDRRLTENFDAALLAKARALVALTEQDEDGVELEINTAALPDFSREEESDHFLIVDAAARVLFASVPVEEQAARETLAARIAPDDAALAADGTRAMGEPRFTDGALPGGRPGRYVSVTYFPKIDLDDEEEGDDDAGGTLSPFAPPGVAVMADGERIVPERLRATVGTSRAALDTLLAALDLILALAGVVIAASIVLLARIGIRRALAPLERLVHEVSTIDEGSLERRLALEDPVAELAVVVDNVNRLIERLALAFERERRFSADVAHELRTPLAELRTLLEVRERFPEDAALAATSHADLKASTERMQHTVESLLALAHSDSGALDAGGELALGEALVRAVERWRSRAETRELAFDLALPPEGAIVAPGADLWPLILDNLVGNAVRYAPQRSRVAIALEALPDARFRLAIANATDELEAEDLPHLCERLWRKERSRSAEGNAGLGLALVAAYAAHLGLAFETRLEPAHGESVPPRFTITLAGDHSVGRPPPRADTLGPSVIEGTPAPVR